MALLTGRGWGLALALAALLLLLAGLALAAPAQAAPAQAAPAPAVSRADGTVVEQLRVKVPAADREAWLTAERGSWGPWLATRPGFVNRQLFWDPEREEATILIHWRSRAQWQAIDEPELKRVQERFEELARQASGQAGGNPFPLVFAGELLPQ